MKKLTIFIFIILVFISCGNPMSGGGSSGKIHERVGEGGSQYDPVKIPTISGVNPVIGSHSGGSLLFISGTNFYSGSLVYIGAQLCDSITFINKTSLRCVTPSSGLGIFDVKVYNEPAKEATLANSFEYRTANNPAHMFMAQGLQTGTDFVTQSGSDFLTGDNIIIEKIVEGI